MSGESAIRLMLLVRNRIYILTDLIKNSNGYELW